MLQTRIRQSNPTRCEPVGRGVCGPLHAIKGLETGMARTGALTGSGSAIWEAVTQHTLPRDFGMHPVDMVWQITLGGSEPPASGAALRSPIGAVFVRMREVAK